MKKQETIQFKWKDRRNNRQHTEFLRPMLFVSTHLPLRWRESGKICCLRHFASQHGSTHAVVLVIFLVLRKKKLPAVRKHFTSFSACVSGSLPPFLCYLCFFSCVCSSVLSEITKRHSGDVNIVIVEPRAPDILKKGSQHPFLIFYSREDRISAK